MKQLELKNETQQPKNIPNVFTERQKFNLIANRMNSSIASTGDKGKRTAIEHADKLNIFLTQNKGKGPPGRQRSPVASPQPSPKWRGSLGQRLDEEDSAVNTCCVKTFPLKGNQKGATFSLTSKFSLSKTNSDDFETITNSEIDDYKKYKFYFIQLLNSIIMKLIIRLCTCYIRNY